MSRDHDRQEQRLRDLLEESRRGYNSRDEELPEDDLLHIRPKPRVKKKKLPKE